MRGSGSENPTYACPRGSDGTAQCDAPATVSRARLDEYIVTYALARLNSADRQTAGDGSAVDGRHAEFERELADLDAQLNRLEEDRAAGVYHHAPERWRDQHRAKPARMQELRRELEELQVVAAQREVEPLSRTEWDELPVAERREILGLLIEEVRVEKAGRVVGSIPSGWM